RLAAQIDAAPSVVAFPGVAENGADHVQFLALGVQFHRERSLTRRSLVLLQKNVPGLERALVPRVSRIEQPAPKDLPSNLFLLVSHTNPAVFGAQKELTRLQGLRDQLWDGIWGSRGSRVRVGAGRKSRTKADHGGFDQGGAGSNLRTIPSVSKKAIPVVSRRLPKLSRLWDAGKRTGPARAGAFLVKCRIVGLGRRRWAGTVKRLGLIPGTGAAWQGGMVMKTYYGLAATIG